MTCKRCDELEAEIVGLRVAFDTAIELLQVPEHAQDDEWYEKQNKVHEAFTQTEAPLLLDVVKWAEVNIPKLECYGDEDCHHCIGMEALKTWREAK